ncbi:retinaldehyde-binding protein 1-like [Culicoides brevitarsis]|uniref:retinaldehyde-binding protein 1-like n=1 Tax=Culicoides brevitarsis TaxID=469753 RepID=UPI00307B5C7E
MQLKKYDKHGRSYLEICKGYEIKLEFNELSEVDKEKARIELRETPENVEKGLKELRELIENDDTIFVCTEIDNYLMRFLRPTKFYAKNSYNLLRSHFEFKEKYPEYCKNILPKTAKQAFEHNIISFSPKRDQHRRRILITKVGNWDPNVVSVYEIFRAAQLSVEVAALEPVTQVNGYVSIMDFKGLSWNQCLVATPFNTRMFMQWFQNAVPLRCKAIHCINCPMLFGILFNIVKPLIGSKLKNRIYFHSSCKTLLEHVDADCLPECYGGTMECEEPDGKLVAEILEEASDEFERKYSCF